MDALILFSHGSVLCGSGKALDAHAQRLRETGKWRTVTVGYLNYSEPTFLDAVKLCSEGGSSTITVAPYFLIPGYFVSRALPQRVDEARSIYPDLIFRIAPALGFDSRLGDAILESAASPLPPAEWRGDLDAAPDHCIANPQCPLYGTPNCPLVPERPIVLGEATNE